MTPQSPHAPNARAFSRPPLGDSTVPEDGRRADTSPAAAEALKLATHNQYVVPALERTRRHVASVWAVLAIGAAGVLLQWGHYLTKKGLAAVLVACIVAVAAGPIIEQIKSPGKPTPEG